MHNHPRECEQVLVEKQSEEPIRSGSLFVSGDIHGGQRGKLWHSLE